MIRHAVMAGALGILSGCGESPQQKSKAPSQEQTEQIRKESDEKAWADAAKLGTVAAFKAYLQGHPSGAHADEARKRIAALEEEVRKQAEEQARKQAELKTHRQADEKAWAEASGAGTIEALRAYLDSHPAGTNASEARKRIAALEDKSRKETEAKVRREAEVQALKEADAKAWSLVLSTSTIESLNAYLKAHPSGAHAAEARTRLAALEKKFYVQQAAASGRKARALGIPTVDLSVTCQPLNTPSADDGKKGRKRAAKRKQAPDDACLKSEHAALDDIIKQWRQFSREDRTRCVTPHLYSPSYVEWLTCLEMQRDVRKLRQENPEPLQPAPKRRR
jgi:hypothetical protein